MDDESQAPQSGMSRGKAAAWVVMLAVGAAMVLVMLAPESAPDPTAVQPPLADASGPVAAIEPLADDPEAVLEAGMLAPLDYTLKDMDGFDVSLASFKGKVILINFWATWCGPCKAEIPDLVELQSEYPDTLVVLGVSVDDTAEKMKPYAEQYGINYPVLVANGRDDFKDAYGPLWGIPVSVIVDREGRIHVRHVGLGTYEQFEQEILTLL
jgi:thiol-disulfide isomerase/thioredoxin